MTTTTGPELDRLLAAAATAPDLGDQPPARRAVMLRDVADRLDEHRESLVALAERETHLPPARLVSELARTTGQLRFISDVVVDGAWLGATIDTADPADPLLRPDVRSVHVPLGVALVFAAGNFPFAFSVAGGDTASALAAGCPVVLKVHDGHPELSASVGGIVKEVFGDGFGLIYGTEAGRAAAVDRRVRAAAFTGSTAGGRALFDLATGREDPIPFYGELGSVNPVFVTPAAARARGDEIADGYVASFTLATGQMCTKPGLLFLPAGHGLGERIAERAAAVTGARMLEERIAERHAAKRAALRGVGGMRVLVGPDADDPAMPRPTVLLTSMAALSDGPSLLREECFGPTSIVVEYDDADELLAAARVVEGSLTATVHAEPGDAAVVERLVAGLQDRAGRIVWNGWPTGVRVGWAMQHGGPWPASTSGSHTSVGAAAINRFTRPLAFQNAPQAHLPPALRDRNELGIPRRVDGFVTTADVGDVGTGGTG
jgi:NADP-dependent aldehyde dehydrogenase